MTHGLLIVGGGLAAQRCCETLRALGHDAPITIVGPSAAPPTTARRSPRSSSPARRRGCGRASGTPSTASRCGSAPRRSGCTPARRVVELAGGERLRYDDLLIATGSEPVRLPALAGFANVQALRTFDDAARLRAALRRARR